MTPFGLVAALAALAVGWCVWQDVRALLRDEWHRRERRCVADLAERAAEEARRAARAAREAAAAAEPLPAPVEDLVAQWGDDDARDAVRKRARELHAEHRDWGRVFVALQQEQDGAPDDGTLTRMWS
jgi:hypothetical protein